jgi:hypothetical protein
VLPHLPAAAATRLTEHTTTKPIKLLSAATATDSQAQSNINQRMPKSIWSHSRATCSTSSAACSHLISALAQCCRRTTCRSLLRLLPVALPLVTTDQPPRAATPTNSLITSSCYCTDLTSAAFSASLGFASPPHTRLLYHADASGLGNWGLVCTERNEFLCRTVEGSAPIDLPSKRQRCHTQFLCQN